jgi:DNA-binding NtrC family response regulator
LALENNGPDAFSPYLQRVFSSSSLETPFTLFRRYVRGRIRGQTHFPIYRLNVIEIRIPPLRERREDALKILMDYDWPGNVRELENAVERALVTCRGQELTDEDFSFLALSGLASKPWAVPTGMTLQEMEKQLIVATIQRTGGNIKESASILGIDRSTMYEKIKRYDIPR